MQALFGGLSSASGNVEIVLADAATRKSRLAADGQHRLSIFSSRTDDVTGELKVTVAGGKRVEHGGIRIELRGTIEVTGEKGSHEFTSQVRELAPGGHLSGLQAFKFSFAKPELPFETYTGTRAKVRYVLRGIVSRVGGFAGSSAPLFTRDVEIVVQNPSSEAAALAMVTGPGDVVLASGGGGDTSIKLEVGIEDCLHIEFEYARTRYHLADVVTGRIDFLLVRIKIKYMEIAVVRKETVGLPGSQSTESETLTRYEVMDGAPVRGDRIPIRVPLSGLDLTPTVLAAAGGLLNVRYYLNLVLVDEEDRRYFKQQEIVLWRRDVKE